MNYKILELTNELLDKLKSKGLAWQGYDLRYRSVAVFPPNKEKPLICTKEMWNNYYKPLWDKCIFTYNPQKAYESCENPDVEWGKKYRTWEHLQEVYNEKTPDYQKHHEYNTYWVSTTRHTWTASERAEFRHTDTWIYFSNSMKKSHNFTCEHCGLRFLDRDLEVHHKIEDVDYDNLDPSRFLVLCLACHDKTHKYSEVRTVTPLAELRVKKVKKIKTTLPLKKIKRIKEIKSME